MTAAGPGTAEERQFPVRIGGYRTMDEIVLAGRYDGVREEGRRMRRDSLLHRQPS